MYHKQRSSALFPLHASYKERFQFQTNRPSSSSASRDPRPERRWALRKPQKEHHTIDDMRRCTESSSDYSYMLHVFNLTLQRGVLYCLLCCR